MTRMKVVLGADHAGFELKNSLKAALAARGIQVDDKGTHSAASVDYPEFARLVGEQVAGGGADFGILVCGTGIGMSIAANKISGVRAAKVDTEYEAEMSRAHNDANVLCLGARVLDTEAAGKIATRFLQTAFEGGRHQRRIEQMMDLERGGAASQLTREPRELIARD